FTPTYLFSFLQKSEELLLSQFSKPKQKRHRCRNPNKIDINTLTGDERVPVVNRRNGRKMGGAMAPPMKELPRWLLENPEFSIAPDWTDIVKQSVRGINPLLLNSLFGGMDLSSLQSLQSLQLAAGLMAFPPPADPKQSAANAAAAASMLPLMLPGMGGLPNMAAAIPNMFSLGLFGGNLAAAATTSNTNASSGNTNGTSEGEGGNGEEMEKRRREAEEREAGEDGDEMGEADEEEEEVQGDEDGVKKVKKRKMEGEVASGKMAKAVSDVTRAPKLPAAETPAEVSINGDTAALLAAAGMSANSLAFNPFLLSTVAPGLLYPSMFLPPGLAGLSLPGFPTASLAELQSAMAGALGESASTPNPPKDEEEEKREDGKAAEEEDEEEEGEEMDLAEQKEEGGMGVAEESAASPQNGSSD
ncbi:hypothetical protein GOODEAATRI_001788, partial [Goodea atripinnis]